MPRYVIRIMECMEDCNASLVALQGREGSGRGSLNGTLRPACQDGSHRHVHAHARR